MNELKKVVIDSMGGDRAPLEILKGCAIALKNNPHIALVVVGDEDIVRGILAEEKADMSRVEIVHATDVISNDDSAASAIRSRDGSTIVVAYKQLKERDDCIGLVSAGSSGAVLSGGLLRLGRIKGVLRPTLLSIFPTRNEGQFVYLTDCGANIDCKPEYLEQFALMGNEYAKIVAKVEKPRIALLNVGHEEHKGNELTKASHALIKKHAHLNYVGNMEAREYISGNYDVVVADGFSGNAMMKATEGAGINFLKVFKRAAASSFFSKIGALLMKKQIKKAFKIMDFNEYGGAYFLGCEKLVCKAHGASYAKSISIAIKETYEVADAGIVHHIKEVINAQRLQQEAAQEAAQKEGE